MPEDNQSNIKAVLSTDEDAADPNFNKFDQLMMETRAVLLRYDDYKPTVTIMNVDERLIINFTRKHAWSCEG